MNAESGGTLPLAFRIHQSAIRNPPDPSPLPSPRSTGVRESDGGVRTLIHSTRSGRGGSRMGTDYVIVNSPTGGGGSVVAARASVPTPRCPIGVRPATVGDVPFI